MRSVVRQKAEPPFMEPCAEAFFAECSTLAVAGLKRQVIAVHPKGVVLLKAIHVVFLRLVGKVEGRQIISE